MNPHNLNQQTATIAQERLITLMCGTEQTAMQRMRQLAELQAALNAMMRAEYKVRQLLAQIEADNY